MTAQDPQGFQIILQLSLADHAVSGLIRQSIGVGGVHGGAGLGILRQKNVQQHRFKGRFVLLRQLLLSICL